MISNPRTWRVHVAATFMHEIGHSLGITPWTVEGCDNLSSFAMFFTKDWKHYKETWGNYYSVMNYFWLVMNDFRKQLIDYSDGSNADTGYDINDWKSLYLPTFQTVSECNEDKTAVPPCYDLVLYELTAREKLDYKASAWEYDENLTEEYLQNIGQYSPIDPIKITYVVYKKTDQETKDEHDIRVYGFANVLPTTGVEYLLLDEGVIDSKGELQFYSQQDLIKDTMEQIKKEK